MKSARVLTLAIAPLGALTVFAIWQATAQQPVREYRLEDPNRTNGLWTGTGSVSMGVVDAGDLQMDKLHRQEATENQAVKNLLRDYSRSTDEALRGKLKVQLSAALEKQFDIQQQRRELEAARIEAQLKKLRDLMKKRTDARQTIVEKRLDQLVREADGLGWTAPTWSQSTPGNPFTGTTTVSPAGGLQTR